MSWRANDHLVDEDPVGHVWEVRIPQLELRQDAAGGQAEGHAGNTPPKETDGCAARGTSSPSTGQCDSAHSTSPRIVSVSGSPPTGRRRSVGSPPPHLHLHPHSGPPDSPRGRRGFASRPLGEVQLTHGPPAAAGGGGGGLSRFSTTTPGEGSARTQVRICRISSHLALLAGDSDCWDHS